MCTYGTCSYSSVTLVIRHKSLCSVLSLSDVYLWDLSASDLWDPTAYVSCVPMGPFSISTWHVGPNGLSVMCTYGTYHRLHLTCGTRRLACHLYLLCHRGLINSRKTSMPGSRTQDSNNGMHGLYHCARFLVVLTCLWSCYSIIFSVWMPYRLTYIGYFPFKWKQICAR